MTTAGIDRGDGVSGEDSARPGKPGKPCKRLKPYKLFLPLPPGTRYRPWRSDHGTPVRVPEPVTHRCYRSGCVCPDPTPDTQPGGADGGTDRGSGEGQVHETVCLYSIPAGQHLDNQGGVGQGIAQNPRIRPAKQPNSLSSLTFILRGSANYRPAHPRSFLATDTHLHEYTGFFPGRDCAGQTPRTRATRATRFSIHIEPAHLRHFPSGPFLIFFSFSSRKLEREKERGGQRGGTGGARVENPDPRSSGANPRSSTWNPRSTSPLETAT